MAIAISSTRRMAYTTPADSALILVLNDEPPHVPAFAELAEFDYILRDYNGLLTVFTRESPDTPFYRTDVRVRTLRQHDQNLLVDGILVENNMKLQQLLDDFTT